MAYAWLLASAALVWALIYLVVSRVIYQPTRFPGGWWHTQADLGARDAWIDTSDGLRLHAWFVEAAGSPLVTLYFHGNGGNLANRPGHLRAIASAGSSVLILDYRGYGKSPGRTTERGVYRDADAAYAHLAGMGYTPDRIVILGESLGSAVAVELASRRPCAGLILECPFTSLSAMAGKVVPWIGRPFASGYNSLRKIGRVHAPLLVIHGDRDRTVPYEMGRQLYLAANEPKTFWTIEGAGHQNLVDKAGPLYPARLRAFYESLPTFRNSGSI